MPARQSCPRLTIPLLLLSLPAVGAAAGIHTIYTFTSQSPTSGLTQIAGGDYVLGLYSPNAVGRFTPQGGLSMVYTFPANGRQCIGPNALLQASDGNLYGTCSAGGTANDGTIFKLTLSGEFTLLYTFQGSDGRSPAGKLVEGDDGALYGVTSFGGPQDAGTVFRVSPGGLFTPVFSFNGTTTGYNVNGGLIIGNDGAFYGTTFAGGTNPYGSGTIFRITPNGNFTTLYSFDGIDGYYPDGPVIEGPGGTLYGTVTFGGRWDFGVVYGFTPAGAYEILGNFDDSSNGADPYGALVQGSDGNIYGITDAQYYFGGGTAFGLSDSGITSLASFGDCCEVLDGLIQSEGGGLRGVTKDEMFTMQLGLPEPLPAIASFKPASGPAGTVVNIRGGYFAYASQVMFNGVPATFRKSSANFIQAVVPVGASTGQISVQNLGGTAISNAVFTVTP